VLLCGAAVRVLAGGPCAGLGSYYLASEHGWLIRTGGVQVSLWVMLCWHVSACLLGRPLAACPKGPFQQPGVVYEAGIMAS
jgi:hypothetical protein